MLFSVLKHGAKWKFRIKAETFEMTIMSFLEVVEQTFHYHCVKAVEKEYGVRSLVERDTVFKHHPYAQLTYPFSKRIDLWEKYKRTRSTLAESINYTAIRRRCQ